ncbi:MAG: D-alanyl-D-alanine carboxypeptidase/D-alanyl-D-alanine-endopeptidase [Pseudomonadota bacterium]
MQTKAAALIAEQGFSAADVGYLVFDLSDGTILSEQNADRLYIPASLQKVPTLLFGLERLGSGHRFDTQLLTSGRITGGRLIGDLYLKGGGDPFLSNDDLLPLIDQLKAAGITRVDGRFFFDDSALPAMTELNPSQPRAVGYNPGLSALNLNFNVLDLNWVRDQQSGSLAAGAVATADETKVTADAVRISQLPASRGKTVPYLPDLTADGDGWLLSPELPNKGWARVPVKLPALNAARIFRQLAAQRGVTLPQPQAGIAPPDSRGLAKHRSKPLVEAVRLILRHSNNLSAEVVALMAASHGTTPALTLIESGRRITNWLRSKVPQADWRGLLLANGSGLTSQSRMTARQMATILLYGHSLRVSGLDVPALMSKPRWQKQLRSLRRQHGQGLEVRGKTGTIYFSRAYAGYLDSKDGRPLGFALFVSDLNQRQRYDAALNIDELVAPPGASGWMRRAKTLERELVSLWLVSY